MDWLQYRGFRVRSDLFWSCQDEGSGVVFLKGYSRFVPSESDPVETSVSLLAFPVEGYELKRVEVFSRGIWETMLGSHGMASEFSS